MDLLLFFIKRDEIDIYDIPIAQIADEYLKYVRVLKEVDLDGVGDFIYMAALLINIKARMLLPSENTDEEGEAVDPRRELVERLLEYVRFKEASEQLEYRQSQRQDHFTRGAASSEREGIEDNHEVEVEGTVYDLVQALGQMLREVEEEDDPVHEVEPLQHSIESQQAYVIERVASGEPVSFRSLIRRRSKGFIIATFLAVLELARQREVLITLNEDKDDFMLERQVGEERDAADAETNAAPDMEGEGRNGALNGTQHGMPVDDAPE